MAGRITRWCPELNGYTRQLPKLNCFRDLLIKLDPAELEAALRSSIAADLQFAWDEEFSPHSAWMARRLCRAASRHVGSASSVENQKGHVFMQYRVSDITYEFKAALKLRRTL